MKICVSRISKLFEFDVNILPKCKPKYEKYSQFIFGAYGNASVYSADTYDIAVYRSDFVGCFDTRILKLAAMKYPTRLCCACYSVTSGIANVCTYPFDNDYGYFSYLASAIACDVHLPGNALSEIRITLLTP